MPRVKKMTERWEYMAESSVSMPHTYFASSLAPCCLAPCTALSFNSRSGMPPHVHFVFLHVVLLHVQALSFDRSISNERALPVGLLHSRFQSSVNKMLRKRFISSFESPIPFSR